MGLLQCTTTLLGSNGQWDSFTTPPHCWGVAGSGTPSIHRHIAGEQWAVGPHFVAMLIILIGWHRGIPSIAVVRHCLILPIAIIKLGSGLSAVGAGVVCLLG